MGGYFNNSADAVEAWIGHDDGKILQPIVARISLDEEWLVGIPEVNDLLMKHSDETFAAYRPYVPAHRPPGLIEYIGLARGYINACGGTEARRLNAKANTIGGLTQIAMITPYDGFRWVEGRGN